MSAQPLSRDRGPWQSGQIYLHADFVTLGTARYRNQGGWHRAGVFRDDLQAGHWRLESGTAGLTVLDRPSADAIASNAAAVADFASRVAAVESQVASAPHHSHADLPALETLTAADITKLKAFDAAALTAATAQAQTNAAAIAQNLSQLQASQTLITQLQAADAHHGRTDNPHAVTAAQVGAAPDGHLHQFAEVTGLQTALDAKAASGHTHSGFATPADITLAIGALTIPSPTDVAANTAARHAAASVASAPALGLSLAGQALTLDPFTARNYREFFVDLASHDKQIPIRFALFNYTALTAGTYKFRAEFLWNYRNISSDVIVSLYRGATSAGTLLGETWRSEPKDGRDNQRFSGHVPVPEITLPAGPQAFSAYLSTERDDEQGQIHDFIMSVERVR